MWNLCELCQRYKDAKRKKNSNTQKVSLFSCLQKDVSSEENDPTYFLENNIVRCGHGKHKTHNLEIWAFKLLLYFCSFHDLVTSVGKFKDPSSGMQEVAKEAHLAMRSNS